MSYKQYLYLHFITNFTFYAVKSFLILYLTRMMSLSISDSLLLFGNIMGLSYFLPLIMANIADRYFNNNIAIYISFWLLLTGFLMLSLSTYETKIIGFSLICLAAGFYKPCLLAEIARAQIQEARKATTLYYMSCNLSGLLSGITAGGLISLCGFENIFFAFIPLLIHPLILQTQFVKGQLKSSSFAKGIGWTILAALIVIAFLSQLETLKFALPFLLIASMGFTLLTGVKQKVFRSEKGHNIIAALLIFTAFTTFFEIFGSVTTLFIERHIDRVVFNYLIPTPFFHSFNSLAIIAIGSFLLLLKKFKGIFKTDLKQLSAGFLTLATSIGLLILIKTFPSYSALAIMGIIIVIQSLGEILIVPKILEILGKNSPEFYKNRSMSLWTGCIAAGHLMTSHLSTHFFKQDDLSWDNFRSLYAILFLGAMLMSALIGLSHYLKERKNSNVG